jgi:hypothetical protein
MGVGESTSGVVIYPACLACRGSDLLYSSDEILVRFDDSVEDIVRAVAAEFQREMECDALEQATTESESDYDEDASASEFTGRPDNVGEFAGIL